MRTHAAFSPRENQQPDKDCIDAINQYATCGFFLSVSHDDTQLIQATAPGFNLSAYGFLCWNSLICVRQWMDNAAFNGQAAYVFESGCYGYIEINKFMHGMFSKDHRQSLTEKFRYHSHTFQEKTTSPHLQAADVLVWHAQKQYSHMPNKPEGIRRDFEELLEVETLNFNFGRNSLLGLAKRYEKLGVQYAQEP